MLVPVSVAAVTEVDVGVFGGSQELTGYCFFSVCNGDDEGTIPDKGKYLLEGAEADSLKVLFEVLWLLKLLRYPSQYLLSLVWHMLVMLLNFVVRMRSTFCSLL